jgi:hypothetical protein
MDSGDVDGIQEIAEECGSIPSDERYIFNKNWKLLYDYRHFSIFRCEFGAKIIECLQENTVEVRGH